MSPLRTTLLALALLPASAAPAAAAGDPVMPLSQVQRGMTCTAYTVIRGTEPTSFDAVVEDVVHDSTGGFSILTRISGAAVDRSGMASGFSGSPIYCPSPVDGSPLVAGALAATIGDYENKVVLATPIEAMLGEPVVPPSSARRATAAERAAQRGAARPMGALSISGLSAPVAAAFQRIARRAGHTLRFAPAALRATEFPVQTLRPGSAVGVSYSSGDIVLGGSGTVSYVDGASVWAFGHPYDSVGRRSLFLQDAFVYGVVDSPSVGGGQSSWRITAPGHDLGTLSGDGAFSVTGTTGALPPHFPLTITANDRDARTTTKLVVHVADEREIGNPTGFSPLGLVGTTAVAQASYATLHGSPLNSSGDMCMSVRVAEYRKAMGFCNTYVQAGTGLATDGASALAGTMPVVDFGTAASLLDGYRLGPLHITGVNVTINLQRGLAQAFMTRMTGPSKVTRGKDYRVRLFFKRLGAAKGGSISFKVHAPLGMRTGPRDLVLTGTPSDLAGGGPSSELTGLIGGSDEAGPATPAELASNIGKIHRSDGITASFRPRRGPDRPPAAPTPPGSLPGGAEGKGQRERPAYRDPRLRYSGAVALPVVVR